MLTRIQCAALPRNVIDDPNTPEAVIKAYAQALDHVEGIATGRIEAHPWTRAVVTRLHAEIELAGQGVGPWVFDPVRALRPVAFAHEILRWTEIVLTPAQHLFMMTLAGFVSRHTGKRRFRRATLRTRKPGSKQQVHMVAAFALYTTFTEGNEHARAIVSADVFGHAGLMLLKSHRGFREGWNVKLGEDHTIVQPHTDTTLTTHLDEGVKFGIQNALAGDLSVFVNYPDMDLLAFA